VNAAYTYKRRYTLSGSARKDESNLFGVKTNQKGVPLWSAGFAWAISQEAFYHVAWLPELKLRITKGYNGNIDKSVTAFVTARMNANSAVYNLPTGTITNPPNPSLRWEKVDIQNIGIDFATRGRRIEGSLEYYTKRGTDLIGVSPIAPSTGISEFRGNTADIKGHGLDLVLNCINMKGPFFWKTNFLFSYVTDKVTSYKAAQDIAAAYASQQTFNPLEGRPLYSIYSFKWAGLDPQTGDPMGYLNGKPSKDYVSILSATDLSTLVYHGSATPRVFGSIRNTFSWKGVSLSCNITYKMAYYFKRRSFVNADLISLQPMAVHADYAKRWQKPGDEKITDVPSLVYPSLLSGRDNMYQASEILVEKGDHIRLQDIQLSYDLNRQQVKKLPVQNIRFYVYASNLGILWKANDKGIDPDFVIGLPNPRTIAVGASIDF
jgi:hypothetical protein